LEAVDAKESVLEFELRWLRSRRRWCSSISDRMVDRNVFDDESCARTSSPVSGEPSVKRDVRGAEVGDECGGMVIGRFVAILVDDILVVCSCGRARLLGVGSDVLVILDTVLELCMVKNCFDCDCDCDGCRS
jgi:hypothetical protein